MGSKRFGTRTAINTNMINFWTYQKHDKHVEWTKTVQGCQTQIVEEQVNLSIFARALKTYCIILNRPAFTTKLFWVIIRVSLSWQITILNCFSLLTLLIYLIPNSNLDPCEEIKCGIDAICKVVFATGRAFCACPFLMVGDPYVKCGKLLEFELFISRSKYDNVSQNVSLYIFFHFRGSPRCADW